MRVFVTGGTGLVGTRLVRKLLERGDKPVVLTRRYAVARQALGPSTELIEGDPTQTGSWVDVVKDCDAVIHLAGENVFGKRWNADFKKRLVDSRIQSTQRVVEALSAKPKQGNGQPKTLINASAIGIYGPRGDEEIDEKEEARSDFLADLCVQWEQAARRVESAGCRCAIVRVGVVLDPTGGALASLLLPFKMFAGGPVGSGKQYMSWIHHEDLVGLFLFLLDRNDCSGPFNGTAPNPVTNKEFSRALGQTLHRPSFVWTPGLALRVMLGEVASIITAGQRVVPRRALEKGFVFRYPQIDAALAQLFA